MQVNKTNMEKRGIYQIESNEKRYIGSTTRSFKERWREHLKQLRDGTHENCHIQNTYSKYGEKSFKFSILEIIEERERIILIEQNYLDKLVPEFNMCEIAGNTLGYKFTEEQKQKLSRARRGNKNGMGNKNWLGRKHTAETRRKMSDAQKGRTFSEESLQKMSKTRKGRKHTDETKRKLSEAGKLYYQRKREDVCTSCQEAT